MAKLDTSYLGLELPNPILAGSSGLTGNIRSLKILEEKGIGGVVLKSLLMEVPTGQLTIISQLHNFIV